MIQSVANDTRVALHIVVRVQSTYRYCTARTVPASTALHTTLEMAEQPLQFVGKYEMVEQHNVDDYLKALGKLNFRVYFL